MKQSEQYKHTVSIGRVGDIVGADHSRDALRVVLADQTADGLDVSGETLSVDPVSSDAAGDSAATVEEDEPAEVLLRGPGAERLVGRVDRAGAFNVVVHWQTASGDTVFSDTVVAAGSRSEMIDEPAVLPHCEIEIQEATGDNNQDAAYGFQLR